MSNMYNYKQPQFIYKYCTFSQNSSGEFEVQITDSWNPGCYAMSIPIPEELLPDTIKPGIYESMTPKEIYNDRIKVAEEQKQIAIKNKTWQ